eukprot:m.343000 g.343000  ORF g.343000 m.343000 type:complete len:481 (+) comp22194_c0_seq1:125-1567(+)
MYDFSKDKSDMAEGLPPNDKTDRESRGCFVDKLPWLTLVSFVMHLFERCPVICFHAPAGDFYHTTNIGIGGPWVQGPAIRLDVILSITSLTMGFIGLLSGLYSRCWARQRLVLLRVLWALCALAFAYRFLLARSTFFRDSHMQYFQSIKNTCAASTASAAYAPPKLAIMTADMSVSKDKTCVKRRQMEYAEKYGYDIIRNSDLLRYRNVTSTDTNCSVFWDLYGDILPEVPQLQERLTKIPFHHFCKIANLLVALQTRKDIEWLVWLDHDAVIMNVDIELTDYIPSAPVDFIVSIGHEDGGKFDLPVGMWHEVFPHVPAWSKSAGPFNSGVYFLRNSETAIKVLEKALTYEKSDQDQRATAWAMFSYTGTPRIEPDQIIRMNHVAVRVVVPRCLNAHPTSSGPHNRWFVGDFVLHTWGIPVSHWGLHERACELSEPGNHAIYFSGFDYLTVSRIIIFFWIIILYIWHSAYNARQSNLSNN